MTSTVLNRPTTTGVRCGICKVNHPTINDVRNCFKNKYAPAPVVVPAAPAPRARLNFSAIADGNYAVRVDGVVKFYRVSTKNGYKNVQVRASDALHMQYGKVGIAILHRIVEAGLEASQQLYASELGRCWMCGKTLTDEESRSFGTGPNCGDRR